MSLFEKSTSTNRNFIALLIIIATFLTLIAISIVYLLNGGGIEITSERLLGTLVPLLSTWIGTVLAFYFGRENFEAASNRYEQIIQKLTPDVLDDISVNQLMILRKTMVSKNLDEIISLTVQDLLTFLDSVDKSRLPVIKDESIKYIIHKSTLLEAMKSTPETEPIPFKDFVKSNEKKITSFLEYENDIILENILPDLKKNQGVKDVFINNSEGKLLGWLTDTLIMRFMS